MEKVEKLVLEKTVKQDELEALSKQTAKDLWRTDLDALLAKWEEFEEGLYVLENKEAVKGCKKGGKKTGKKALQDSDSDDFEVKTSKKGM